MTVDLLCHVMENCSKVALDVLGHREVEGHALECQFEIVAHVYWPNNLRVTDKPSIPRILI